MTKTPPQEDTGTTGALRVLYVEDNPADAELILRYLRKEYSKLSPDVVATPEEFQERLRSETYDVVLSDYKLPNWSGMEALAVLRQQGTNIPFILVTGTMGDEAAVECVKAGVTDYVIKENLSRLPLAIRRALAEKASRDDKRRAEEALRLSEERYRIVAETATDAIITIDEGSTILFINSAAEKIFGYTVREMLGQPITMLMPERLRDAHRASIKRYINTGERHLSWEAIQLPGLHKSGKEIFLEISFGEFIKDGRRMMTGIVRDITERKRLEEQLRQAQKMEAVGQLAGGIAHDFNNLLTIMTGFSELLLERLSPREPLRREVEEIKKAGDRAALLTRQLLTFSRQQVLAPQVLDLNIVLTNIDKMLRRLIGEDIEIVTVPGKALGLVKADPGQIEHVIMNLTINARDAMPQGGKLTIETANVDLDGTYTVKHDVVKPGPYAMLSVSDTGSGMDAETQARIFEPFFTTKEKGKGTGLGLATVYGTVKQSGGYIWLHSEPGRGTTFKIYLPRTGEAPDFVSPKSEKESLAGSETILVVEDEESVRSIVKKILDAKGYHVLLASNAQEALSICQRHQGLIHLLLTDVVMPQMSGRQVADHLVFSRADMKVLYMSGYADDAIVRHGILERGVAFLQKPFTPQTLARKVREVLDRQPQT